MPKTQLPELEKELNEFIQTKKNEFIQTIKTKKDIGLTPLHIAAFKFDDINFIKSLLDKGEDPNLKSKNSGNTTLIYSIMHLQDTKSDKNQKNETFKQILNLLIERGADINQTNNSGLTALHFAADMGELDACKLLVENGANILAQANNTPYQISQETKINLDKKTPIDMAKNQVVKTYLENQLKKQSLTEPRASTSNVHHR